MLKSRVVIAQSRRRLVGLISNMPTNLISNEPVGLISNEPVALISNEPTGLISNIAARWTRRTK